jgi:hypothetical protein
MLGRRRFLLNKENGAASQAVEAKVMASRQLNPSANLLYFMLGRRRFLLPKENGPASQAVETKVMASRQLTLLFLSGQI